MEPLWLGALGVVTLLVLLAAGVHITVALGLLGFIGIAILTGPASALNLLATTLFYKVYNIIFLVIPLFVLIGMLASAGGISRDTYYALSLWLNRVRGGLGMATALACTGFGTICGSSIVTASVFAKVAVPEMRKYGYGKKLSYGLVSAAGSIGMLIPPSVLIMFYSIMTEESPGKLLIAGLSPGILLLIVFSAGLWVIGRIRPASVGTGSAMTGVTWRQRVVNLRLLWPMGMVALIIIVGVFSGFFSLTEASAGGVAVVFLFILISQRSFKNVTPALAEAVPITAMIFFIFIGATLFGRFLTLAGVAAALVDWVVGLELSHMGVVILMSAIYLLLGCFLDGISMIAITTPLIYPAIKLMGIEPIWYAMCVILAIHVGLVTPPVGLNVFAVKGVAEADVSLEDIFIGALPFFAMMVVALAIIIAFPVLSQFLPSLMGI